MTRLNSTPGYKQNLYDEPFNIPQYHTRFCRYSSSTYILLNTYFFSFLKIFSFFSGISFLIVLHPRQEPPCQCLSATALDYISEKETSYNSVCHLYDGMALFDVAGSHRKWSRNFQASFHSIQNVHRKKKNQI